MVEVQSGIFDLIPVTGTVTEEGTPINKAYLQPIEDGLDAALEKTGDGKDVIVTFTEAATEAHITSGEKLSVMFGKILKMFKGKAPNSHASSATTYGVGTTANYGHCKTINNLTQSSHVNGTALSAYQGKVLDDKKADKPELVRTLSLSAITGGTSVALNKSDFLNYEEFIFVLRGTLQATLIGAAEHTFRIGIHSDSEPTQFIRHRFIDMEVTEGTPFDASLQRNYVGLKTDDNTILLYTLGQSNKINLKDNLYFMYYASSYLTLTGTLFLDIYGRKLF